MKHLIIGCSAAGIAAARKIRALRPDDEITVVAKDDAPHSRCMLHHFIGGHKSAEDINFAGADFFDKNRVEFIAGEEITKVLPDEKAVVGAKSGKIRYDRLLITTGARYSRVFRRIRSKSKESGSRYSSAWITKNSAPRMDAALTARGAYSAKSFSPPSLYLKNGQ